MNLDQYLRLNVRSTEVRVAESDLRDHQRRYELVLDELLERGDRPVTGDELRDALIATTKAHQAYVDTFVAIMFHDKA